MKTIIRRLLDFRERKVDYDQFVYGILVFMSISLFFLGLASLLLGNAVPAGVQFLACLGASIFGKLHHSTLPLEYPEEMESTYSDEEGEADDD